ncbi:penicillin-binding protein 2 [Frigoribacterium sp. CG_9.8]|uniref:peptidoglycan D,D-transpeptidase FtsI family protein n=1 Tax=Frigoribacterium sp. CG_9.8 TaxID=2787733 RepID=UPI0018CB4827|nr:cell division protein FtsI (penicillin-binding protein 3) [Frigoribacterium sp. CG_9.8]
MTNPRRSRRRLALAIVMVFAVVGVFAVRLVDIQIVRADQLTSDALNKRAVEIPTYAARGDIVDTNGVALANSVNRYDVAVSPMNFAKMDSDGGFTVRAEDGKKTTVTVLQAATDLATLTQQDPATVYQSMTQNPKSNYALVTKSVDLATRRAIEKLKIPGIVFQFHPKRTYPNGAVAGNLTGYMSTDGPGGGLEVTAKDCLTSVNGATSYEQGADGVQIPGSAVTRKTATPGGTLTLAIDSDLQWFSTQAVAEQGTAIGATSGTAVVLRIKDFHVMAATDWPAVDPNNIDGSDVANFGSQAFTAAYEPGSVFKAMSAAILLDSGIGSPTMQATVPSRWATPEGGFVRDATAHPTQQLTLTGVLQNSSNVGISMLGSQVPEDVRLAYMKKFGLGQKTDINFLGEGTGSLGVTGNSSKPWDNQSKYNVLYGQGVSATALQVAQIFGTLGNGGMRLPLTLVENCTKADGTVTGIPSTTGTRVVSESTAKTVVNMLESVVQGGELSSAVNIPGYRVAGKSGTAEVAGPGGYTSDRIVSFAGIAPAEDPQYVVVVTYTKPATMRTSAAAAPTFKKIMSQVLTKYRVPPSKTPSTYPATTW